MSKKFICFSLFLSDRRTVKSYTQGVIENSILCKKFYGDFIPVFYVQNDLKGIGDIYKN